MPDDVPMQTAKVEMHLSGRRLTLDLAVPTVPVRPSQLLGLYRDLTDQFVDVAVAAARDQGETITCKAGCGACCRQLVPITPMEARAVARLIERLPDERRRTIEARIEAALAKLEVAGLLTRLRERQSIPANEILDFGMDYFRQNIPCPFLEDESCSIHAERPLVCREYLVTNPAENCAAPSPKNIRLVEVAGKVSRSLRRLSLEPDRPRWVPLILAPEWAATHPESAPEAPGPVILRELFEHLTGENIPDVPGM